MLSRTVPVKFHSKNSKNKLYLAKGTETCF